jgi:gluconokinase
VKFWRATRPRCDSFTSGEETLLRARLEQRRGHYMPSSLLASQLAAPGRPGDAITVDVSGTPEAIVEQIRVAAARLND